MDPEEIEQAFPLPEPPKSSGSADGWDEDESGDEEQLGGGKYDELIEHGTLNGREPKDRSVMFHRVVWHLAAAAKVADRNHQTAAPASEGIAAKYLKTERPPR